MKLEQAGLIRMEEGKTHVICPVHPATPEQITLNIKRWQKEQKRKAHNKAVKKAIEAKVGDASSTIGQVVIAHLLKEVKR